jgi:hypothetical protein
MYDFCVLYIVYQLFDAIEVTFRVKENDIDFESHSFAPL